MVRFRDISIRKKLIAAFAVITVTALLISSVSLAINSWIGERKAAKSELLTLARLIGANSSAALVFGDADAARETLDTLRIWPDIVYASLHDTEGVQLARYVREGYDPGTVTMQDFDDNKGVYRDGHITVRVPIVFDDREIGNVILRSSLATRIEQLLKNIFVSIGVLLLSFAIALVFAFRLGKSIAEPLRRLSAMMKEVTSDHDYTRRAKFDQQDEIGMLANGIDEMLAVIEERDESLESHRRRLEETVSLRTAELQEANTRLTSELSEREKAESELQRAHSALEQHYHRFALLSEMNDRLQVCHSVAETKPVVSYYVRQLFIDCLGGGVYLYNPSRTLVESLILWGLPQPETETFRQNDCWALRQGRIHIVNNPSEALICGHCDGDIQGAYLCIPMIAYGDVLGVMHLRIAGEGARDVIINPSEETAQLAINASEHLALSLANLQLREELQTQSVRDPLTGLFNRRYMQETLERELARAQRSDVSLGIVMLDLDHFKKFNDQYGHEAGDIVLRELGDFLKGCIRNEDIACRYGGEEFIIIMPGISKETAELRAEEIRLGVKSVNVRYKGRQLDGLSISMGIAFFPDNGDTTDEIINAADEALYEAKGQGRDRYIMAEIKEVPEPGGN